MPIDDPPILEHFLLEQPWPMVGLLLIVAVAVVVINRASLTRKAILSAVACLLLAMIVYLVAKAVVTERESLINAAAELAQQVETGQADAIRKSLDEQAVITDPAGRVLVASNLILSIIEKKQAEYDFGSHTIADARAAINSVGSGKTYLRVRSTMGQGGTESTEWLIDWRRDKDGRWRVRELRWLKWRGLDPPVELLR